MIGWIWTFKLCPLSASYGLSSLVLQRDTVGVVEYLQFVILESIEYLASLPWNVDRLSIGIVNSKHKLPIAFSITEMALNKDNFSSGYFFASVIHASEDFLIWINQDYRFPFRNAQVAKAIQRPVGSSRYDFKRALLSMGFTEISEGNFYALSDRDIFKLFWERNPKLRGVSSW